MGKLRNLIRLIRANNPSPETLDLLEAAENELNTRNDIIRDADQKLRDADEQVNYAKRNQYMFSIGFNTMQNDVATLKQALRTFGGCKDGCGGQTGGRGACTCGYHEAIGGE